MSWHDWARGQHGFPPRGGRDHWERFGARFAAGWDEARARGGGGGGRQRRMFDGGELRLLLLKLIADEARHGYELIRAVEELTGGAYAPSPGVVYPTLSMLDEMGLIAEQRSDDNRKRFAATGEGRAHLAERGEEVERLMARLAALGEHRQRHQGAPIGRAMQNLGLAIRNRVARGAVSEDTLHDVAALIDELAQRIERLK